MQSPKFDLNEVKELTESVKEHKFTKTKAIDCVVLHLRKTIMEAQRFILAETLRLTEGNFSHSKLIGDIVYDIYGKRIDSIPWYIKFAICEDDKGQFIYYISFHPTERELITQIEVLENYCP